MTDPDDALIDLLGEYVSFLGDEPMLNAAGLSLLTGVPETEIADAITTAAPDPFPIPADWIKAGKRRTKEYAAATGRNDIAGMLAYWQAKQGTPPPTGGEFWRKR